MTGFISRLFTKTQYPGETRRMMHEMHDYKTSQQVIKLESELKSSNDKVQELQSTLDATKIVLEKKDAALSDITRDREKIALELKNHDYCNKYIKQQLEKDRKVLERDLHRFAIEKSNFQTKKELILGQITIPDAGQYPKTVEGCLREISRLQKYSQSLRATLLEREKTITNLCQRYLSMRYIKKKSISNFMSLKKEFDEMSKDLLEKLTEARSEINMIAETKLHEPLDRKNFALVQMVQKNGELILENSRLKLEICELRQSISSLKLEHGLLVDINTTTLEMRAVPSSYTLAQSENRTVVSRRRNNPSEMTNSRSYLNNTPSDMPVRSYRCLTTPRSAPSSVTTFHPDRQHSTIRSTISEMKCTSFKSNQVNSKDDTHDTKEFKIVRKRTKQLNKISERQKRTRRKRESRQYLSDSSRDICIKEMPPEVTNIPSQLLSELHPSVAISNSRDSLHSEKITQERQKSKMKPSRYEETEYSTSQQNDFEAKQKESLESIYSAYYVTPTRSTPGRMETTPFVKDRRETGKIVPDHTAKEKVKYINKKGK